MLLATSAPSVVRVAAGALSVESKAGKQGCLASLARRCHSAHLIPFLLRCYRPLQDYNYYKILDSTILYYTIVYYTILYYTTPGAAASRVSCPTSGTAATSTASIYLSIYLSIYIYIYIYIERERGYIYIYM